MTPPLVAKTSYVGIRVENARLEKSKKDRFHSLRINKVLIFNISFISLLSQ